MAYNQGGYQQPPYGAPPPGHSPQPGYGQYPPPQQGYPPQQPYGAPPPNQYPPQQGYPPQQPYGAPQGQYPPQQPYGAPPPNQYPPQQGYPPQQPYGAPPPGQYGAPQPQYGAPSPQPGYGAPPPQQPYSTYTQPQVFTPPTPATLGYGPPQQIAWDGTADAEACKKAMKGFGTDEKLLIRTLATKDPLQVNVIRDTYYQRHRKHLLTEVQGEVSGWFEEGLCAIIRGPLMQDVYLLHKAMSGPGTKESVLTDILMGRSNADMRAIKDLYQRTYHRSLEHDVKSDLSMKTERHFLMVLAANRNEDSAPVVPQQIDQDVSEIYKATEGRHGTDELLVCSILSQRSDAQISAIAHTYKQKFTKPLDAVIIMEFSGHMEAALLQQLRTGTDKAMRDAMLLEDAMAGAGTKDHLLVNRVVRVHWDRNHMQQVKGAYQHKYRTSLVQRIKGETSGDYERLMVACLGE
ncbi:Annexin A7 [Hyphodiscus hymeniophilus]|uniref:Annexin n=1 Tax=Hyphodiscus hymeniophilus TaxID=353542 RepID=A0A9P6VKT8_9HELO|nr:Annexin A7 [Hyphodiscus hymeniophilus]